LVGAAGTDELVRLAMLELLMRGNRHIEDLHSVRLRMRLRAVVLGVVIVMIVELRTIEGVYHEIKFAALGPALAPRHFRGCDLHERVLRRQGCASIRSLLLENGKRRRWVLRGDSGASTDGVLGGCAQPLQTILALHGGSALHRVYPRIFSTLLRGFSGHFLQLLGLFAKRQLALVL
jgi:hypothetical protein